MNLATLAIENCFLDLRGVRLNSRYETGRRLKFHNFTELFAAHNIYSHEGEAARIVVKAVNPYLKGAIVSSTERSLRESVERETDALRACQHKNIVRLYDYGVARDNFGREFWFLVLESLAGGSLEEMLASGRNLSLQETLDYIAQICAALTHAHAQGFLHRDVKPGNIMFTKNRRTAKLIDFGAARDLDDDGLITEIGTPTYAAPEHYSRHAKATAGKLRPSADVYALAKTVYAMLCGEPPADFKGQPITTLPNFLKMQPHARFVLPVLERATDDDPLARYQTPQEFYEALCDAAALRDVDEETHTTPSSDEEETYFDPAPAPRKSRIEFEIPTQPPPPRSYGEMARDVRQKSADVASRATKLLALTGRKVWAAVSFIYTRSLILSEALGRVSTRASKAFPFKSFSLLIISFAFIGALSFGAYNAWRFAREWRQTSAVKTEKPKNANDNLLTAKTDINLRANPSGKSPKIGLVERDSRVRILSYNASKRWCEIEIVQHGRTVEDIALSDRGWINCENLNVN